MNSKSEQLADVLNSLSVKELEGVLDALVLVAEYGEGKRLESPTDGLGGVYLVPPYGELIASGDMKCFAKPRRDDRLLGDKVLVSGHKAYGEMRVGEPVRIDVGDFDDLFGEEHRISRKDRLRWWPERESLYLYPVEEFKAYVSPLPVETRPGVQTAMKSVPFRDEESNQPVPLAVTVARTESQATKGFSGRDSIDDGEGLLIPVSSTKGIWMKDTTVPLTVAFLDSDCKVLSLIDLQPLDETVHLGPERSAWALEASPSWFQSAAVEIGDVIKLPTTLPTLPIQE